MPRRRYYRRPYRVVAAKKKWASNIIQGTVTSSNFQTIVINSTQTSAPTPTIVKCGNFRIQGDATMAYQSQTTSRVVSVNFFLMFVPEGVTVTDSLIGNHPEWIMGWTAIDFTGVSSASGSSASPSNKFSLTTRLKRNLNSGDRVVVILQSLDSAVTATAVYTIQYWTCAN